MHTGALPPVRAPHPHVPKMHSVGEQQQQQQQRVTPQCWQHHGAAHPTAATQPLPLALLCGELHHGPALDLGKVRSHLCPAALGGCAEPKPVCGALCSAHRITRLVKDLNPTPTMPTAHPSVPYPHGSGSPPGMVTPAALLEQTGSQPPVPGALPLFPVCSDPCVCVCNVIHSPSNSV